MGRTVLQRWHLENVSPVSSVPSLPVPEPSFCPLFPNPTFPFDSLLLFLSGLQISNHSPRPVSPQQVLAFPLPTSLLPATPLSAFEAFFGEKKKSLCHPGHHRLPREVPVSIRRGLPDSKISAFISTVKPCTRTCCQGALRWRLPGHPSPFLSALALTAL